MRKIVLIRPNGKTEVYKSQTELAHGMGVSPGAVNHYVKGRYSAKDCKVMYYDDYMDYVASHGKLPKDENKEPIIKPSTTMYYVNVLVGLANGTLQDGAIYKINGADFVYNKDKDVLQSDVASYSKEMMLKEVEVELPLLLDKERDFLKSLLKAFSKVKGIRKCNDFKKGFEFIRIEAEYSEDDINLPCFIEGKYYANLKKDRLYSLEELGINC